MTPTNSDELKPCPFCGSPAQKFSGQHGSEYVTCIHGGCGVKTQEAYGGYSERTWNTRASRPDPAPVCDGKVGEAVGITGHVINYLEDLIAGGMDAPSRRIEVNALKTLITAAKEAGALRGRLAQLEYQGGVDEGVYEQKCTKLIEENTCLRAKLAKQPERWQPIETAPRDGSSVLVTNGDETWVSSWQPTLISADTKIHCEKWETMMRCDIAQPTHWMPLPQPTVTEDK